MTLNELYAGYRPFANDHEIRSTIEQSKYFDNSQEDPEKATKVQLFETSKQRTYLLSTGKRVYKILDDRRSNHPKIVWSRAIDKIFDNFKLKASLEPSSENTCNLKFEEIPDKINLVSMKLFANISFDDAIKNLHNKHQAAQAT